MILLAQLAVDRRFHGHGFARQLLIYALKTYVALSKDIGCFAVLTHPLDDDVRAFCRRFGSVGDLLLCAAIDEAPRDAGHLVEDVLVRCA